MAGTCNARIRRLGRIAILAAAAFPSTAPRSAGAPETNAAMAVEFESIGMNEETTHRFTFLNADARPLALKKVRPSCDCLHILAYPRTVAARGQGWVDVRLVPEKPGPVAYHAFVEPEDPQAAVRVFTLRGAVADAAVSPERQFARSLFRSVSPRVLTRALRARNAGLYTAMEPVLARLAGPEAARPVLVDVRNSVEYAMARIPGSTNIRPLALRGRRDLKASDLVLVDEGTGTDWMEDDCRGLRERGFASVHILHGGLNAWQAAGGALEGSAVRDGAFTAITAREFYYARCFNDWTVIDADAADDLVAEYFLPEREWVPYEGDARAFGRRLFERLQRLGSRARLLVFNRQGLDYDLIRGALPPLPETLVFFLAGGLDAYHEYLGMLTSVDGGPGAGRPGVAVRTTLRPCGKCP